MEGNKDDTLKCLRSGKQAMEARDRSQALKFISKARRNKDDTLKCLRIGKQAMEARDRSQALKFISKARRLDPTLRIDDLLSEIEKESNGPGDP
ncbi:chaperone protein dnaj 49 [Quercus suber]|uniref:Chaperone protein dnaj 49 n=1 Tax=Quercus suber TaxID=58331 RepID=A0AAW0IC42_QUESU